VQESDTDLGTTGTAGLASVETLDDGTQVNNNAAGAGGGDDGMETVRLDVEAADGTLTKPHPLIVCLTAARRNVVVSGKNSLLHPSFIYPSSFRPCFLIPNSLDSTLGIRS
jgi:hypothetical protein